MNDDISATEGNGETLATSRPVVNAQIVTPKPMVRTDLSALAALFQRWAEMCEQGAENELTAGLQWFLKGMAFAHAFDAKRTRDLNAPDAAGKPPKGDLGMVQAFEVMLGMLQAMGTTEAPEPETEAEREENTE